MSIRKILAASVVAVVAAASLAGCGAKANDGGATADPGKPLRVIADVIPHAELIKHVEETGQLGDVEVEVTQIAGDIDPNQLVEAGDLDANFFQHIPYLKDWNAQHGNADLVSVGAVHIEPLGLYSKKVTLDAVPDGAVIAIPADATNQARALFLLEDAGLLKLDVNRADPDIDYSQITDSNVTENPKNISFVKIDRPQLAASLDDPKVTLSIVNGNYALEAGLTPSKDALFIETADGNPYVNVLVVKSNLVDDARVKKLAEALTSEETAKWITDTYSGSVLPAKSGN